MGVWWTIPTLNPTARTPRLINPIAKRHQQERRLLQAHRQLNSQNLNLPSTSSQNVFSNGKWSMLRHRHIEIALRTRILMSFTRVTRE